MRFSLITLALTLSIPIAASATTYNVVTDFSTATNPNGVWTYGSGTPTSFTPFTYSGSNLNDGYHTYQGTYWAGGPNGLPVVGMSGGIASGSVDVPSNQLWMHPGPGSGQDSIVVFTAPTTGEYTLSFDFFHDDTAGNANGYADGQIVSFGVGTTTTFSDLLGTTYGASTGVITGYGFLNAGETIFFDVNKNGNYYNDSTGLQATVANAPEPSSLVLLGTGILGLAGAARRKLRS